MDLRSMKWLAAGMVLTLLSAGDAYAQQGGGRGGRGGRGWQGPGGGPGSGQGRPQRGRGPGARPGRIFDHLDTNQDGFLDASEIQRVQDPTRQQKLLAADTDGDGKVSRDEFRTAVRKRLQQTPPQGGLRGTWKKVRNLRQLLKSVRQSWLGADKNGDKSLSAAEWQTAGAKTAFADVDADKDGEVTRRELLRWMRQHQGQSPF